MFYPGVGHNRRARTSSLVTNPHNQPWNTKQRRTFQRILSGLKRANGERKRIRIITLTSPPGHPRTVAGGKLLAIRFQILRKRIIRKWGCSFEYLRVRTSEGFGVLHIIYKGAYIPHSWLKNQWYNIHGAEIVFIQALHGQKRLARYLVSQYVAGHHTFMRTSWSWNWVFRGFVGVWYRVRRDAVDMFTAIRVWDIILRSRHPLKYYLESKNKKRWKDGLSIIPLTEYF
ncbi:hypothetical protein ES705_42690 [subsurface metagenome]